jgi:hypothetical protein
MLDELHAEGALSIVGEKDGKPLYQIVPDHPLIKEMRAKAAAGLIDLKNHDTGDVLHGFN